MHADFVAFVQAIIAQEESALHQLRILPEQAPLTSSGIATVRDLTAPANAIVSQVDDKISMERAEAGSLEDGISASIETGAKRPA